MLRALIFAVLAASPAWAIDCLPLPEMSQFLAQSYDETVEGGGRFSATGVGLLFTSPAGTWTFVQVNANTGRACIAAFGDGWLAVDAVGELM